MPSKPTAKASKVSRSPTPALKRRRLVERLWNAAEAQVADIETRLTALDGDASVLERDARSLGLLAKFLKELVAIETLLKDAGSPAKAGKGEDEDDDLPPRDLDAFREELARRLDRLREAREAADHPDTPAGADP